MQNNLNLTPEEHQKVEKLINDFEFRVRNTLTIRTKRGEFMPFALNKAQKYVHAKLEAQKKKKGYIVLS